MLPSSTTPKTFHNSLSFCHSFLWVLGLHSMTKAGPSLVILSKPRTNSIIPITVPDPLSIQVRDAGHPFPSAQSRSSADGDDSPSVAWREGTKRSWWELRVSLVWPRLAVMKSVCSKPEKSIISDRFNSGRMSFSLLHTLTPNLVVFGASFRVIYESAFIFLRFAFSRSMEV